MRSPRWRKRWKALRRAQSPIMLSLNLPQIPDGAYAVAAGAAGAQKGGLPCPKGRPQIGGTMPKTHPRRNAANGLNERFLQLFAANQMPCPVWLELSCVQSRSISPRHPIASGAGLRARLQYRTLKYAIRAANIIITAKCVVPTSLECSTSGAMA